MGDQAAVRGVEALWPALLVDRRPAGNTGEIAMRNTIILGGLIALLGLGTAALANDRSGLIDDDTARVTREASNDGRGERHHRYEHGRRYRDRNHESREHRRWSNENHDAHEAREYR
jgi:hypothetical protein